MTVARTPLLLRRVVAYLVDLFVLFLLISIVFLLPLSREAKAGAVLIYLFFCPLCEWLFGRTPGKYVAGLVVVNCAGRSPTFLQAIIRAATRDIEAQLWFFTVLVYETSSRCQRLGDKGAHTYVMNRKDYVLMRDCVAAEAAGDRHAPA